MQNAPEQRQSHETTRTALQPYTHADHWQRGMAAAQQGLMVERKHVQVKRGPVVYCAQILEAYTVPDGPDCWTVQTIVPEIARFTVPCRLVRECGGSDCTCMPVLQVTAAGCAAAPAGACETGKKDLRCK